MGIQTGQETFRINTIKSPAVQGTCRACAQRGRAPKGGYALLLSFRSLKSSGRWKGPGERITRPGCGVWRVGARSSNRRPLRRNDYTARCHSCDSGRHLEVNLPERNCRDYAGPVCQADGPEVEFALVPGMAVVQPQPPWASRIRIAWLPQPGIPKRFHFAIHVQRRAYFSDELFRIQLEPLDQIIVLFIFHLVFRTPAQ